MGAELCLAHDMGGMEAYGGPLSVDMQPYGCFIKCKFVVEVQKNDRYTFFNFAGDNVTILWSHWYSLFRTSFDSIHGF